LLTVLVEEKLFDQFIFLPEFLNQASDMKFREIASIMFEYQKKIISKSNVKWLSTLPVSLNTAENRLFSVHGAPPIDSRPGKFIETKDYVYALNKYLFPWDQKSLSLSCQVQPLETMVIGHTHMQFAHQSRSPLEPPIKSAHPCLMNYDLFPIRKTFTESYPLLINPGSIGQSRDEIEAPGYATVKFQGKKRIVTWFRYKYDFEAFVNKMKSKNAPEEIFNKEFWHIAD
jgi:predicted phosphodiesterase